MKSTISVGDNVAVLVSIPKSGGRMRWVEGNVLQSGRNILVESGNRKRRFCADTLEQIGNSHDSRGPSRIKQMTDGMRERIQSDSVWYSEYMRKEKSLEYLRKVDWYSMPVVDVEAIAEMAAILSAGVGQEPHEQDAHW